MENLGYDFFDVYTLEEGVVRKSMFCTLVEMLTIMDDGSLRFTSNIDI